MNVHTKLVTEQKPGFYFLLYPGKKYTYTMKYTQANTFMTILHPILNKKSHG